MQVVVLDIAMVKSGTPGLDHLDCVYIYLSLYLYIYISIFLFLVGYFHANDSIDELEPLAMVCMVVKFPPTLEALPNGGGSTKPSQQRDFFVSLQSRGVICRWNAPLPTQDVHK